MTDIDIIRVQFAVRGFPDVCISELKDLDLINMVGRAWAVANMAKPDERDGKRACITVSSKAEQDLAAQAAIGAATMRHAVDYPIVVLSRDSWLYSEGDRP